MKKFTLLLLIVISVAGLSAQNLIQNGGFENWTDEVPDSWIGVKTSLDSTNIVQSDVAFEGTSSAQLTNTGSSHKRFTTDSLAVEVGSTYKVTFAIKGAGDIRTALYDGNWIYNDYVQATSEWVVYSQNITAQATTTAAEFIFSLRNTADSILLDSVVVELLENEADIIDFDIENLQVSVEIDSEFGQVTSTVLWDANVTAITPLITLSNGASISPESGVEQDFTDPVTYTVTAADGTQKEWSVAVEKMDAPVEVSIHDVQYTEDESGDSPLAGSLVEISGIVTGVQSRGFYMQDTAAAWSGVFVYHDETDTSTVVGDEVTVVGFVKEYYGLTQITFPSLSITKVSTNNTMETDTIELSEFGEAYEGVLVSVENVFCAGEANNYGEWTIANATDTVVVDDELFEYEPFLSEIFESITGPITYTYGAYKLLPRSEEDIVTPAQEVFDVTFVVSDENNNAIEEAIVMFNDAVMLTDAVGEILFMDVEAADLAYSVSMFGYNSVYDTVMLNSDTVINITLENVSVVALPFSEDFETVTPYDPVMLDGWVNAPDQGTRVWEGREYDENKYVQFSSYNSDESNVAMLATPVIDLSNVDGAEFSFDVNIGYYTHDALQVYIATTEDEEPVDVSSNFTIPQEPTDGYGTFVTAGTMDLTDYIGDSILIVFVYVGDGNEGLTTTIQVDNVLVEEKTVTETYDITFNVTNDGTALADASVEFNGETKATDATGMVVFSDIATATAMSYTVTKTDYETVTGSVDVDSDKTVDVDMIYVSTPETLATQFKIYPNPANSSVNISLPTSFNGSVALIDMTGRTVYFNEVNAATLQVELSEFESGVYFVKVATQNEKALERLIIRK